MITVRHAEPSDADRLRDIYTCESSLVGLMQLPYRSLDYYRERLAAKSDGYYPLVASVDGKVVGVLGLRIPKPQRMRHKADFHIAVLEGYQRRGVGKALMEAMIDLADNYLGLVRLELQVYADNEAAIGLYRRFGFEAEGKLRAFGFRGGKLCDGILMARIRD